MNQSTKNNLPAKIAIGCVILIICGVICFIMNLVGINYLKNQATDLQKKHEQTLFDNPEELGEKFTVNDIEWTLLEAKDMGSRVNSEKLLNYDCVSKEGKFIFIKIKVKNNQKDSVSIPDFILLDSDKKEYKSSNDPLGCVEVNIILSESIKPGVEKTFVGLYEVPSSSKDFRLKVGELNLFSSNFRFISLGF